MAGIAVATRPARSSAAARSGGTRRRRLRSGTTRRGTAAVGLLTVAASVCVAAVGTQPAGAAYPGRNGAIVMVSDRDGQNGLYSRTALSTGEVIHRRLTLGGTQPTYSPDGRLIAYSSGGDDPTILVMNADGTGTRAVTAGHPGPETDPTWSPDGTRIAFTGVVSTGRNKSNTEIFTVDALGTEKPTNITNSTTDDSAPAWSTSGLIAFVGTRDHRQGIFTMTATGDKVTWLGLDGGRWPAWSPDGGSIAYASFPTSIYVRSAEGAITRISEGATDGMPAWSPDGTQILFRRLFQKGNTFDFRLYTVKLEPGASPVRISDGNGSDYMGDWQPIPVAPCVLAPTCL